MNQVIILEGPDGSGKTTLANEIAERIGADIEHEGPPPRDIGPLEYYGGKLLKYLNRRRPVVLDRFHIGEYVYAPVARDENRLTNWGMRLMNRMLRAYNIKCLICLPPFAKAEMNYREKIKDLNDYLKSKEMWYEIYYRYMGLTYSYETYDYTRHNVEEMTLALENWMAKDNHLPIGMVGDPGARVLFIGEQSNTDLDLPFFSTKNSSHYLNTAIREAGYDENVIAFANIFDKDANLRNPKKFVRNLPYLSTIICLGHNAWESVLEMNLNKCMRVEYVKHPAPRFRYEQKDRDAFVAELRGFLE